MDSIHDTHEIIPGRLFLLSTHRKPKSTGKRIYVCVDDELVYQPFYADFGPLNLAAFHRFSAHINHLLHEHPEKEIYHYTSFHSGKRANAMYLMASYALVHLKRSPEAAARPFAAVLPTLTPFRDASYGACTFKLTLPDCLAGLAKALEHKFYDPARFDVAECEHYERVQNGDLNWIMPGKLLAFAGPHDSNQSDNGYPRHTPEFYSDYFKKNNVTDIIRLNVKLYDASRFTNNGFKHHELYFDDGTTPTDEIMLQFLSICEQAKGAVAIHCKAGLGRTGTLICAYMMKHFQFTALEAIAWNRIARPGSVIGPQQYFLTSKQAMIWSLRGASVSSSSSSSSSSTDKTVSKVLHEKHDINTQENSTLVAGVGAISISTNPFVLAQQQKELTEKTQGDLLNAKKAMRVSQIRSSNPSLIQSLFSKAPKAPKLA